MSGWGDIGIMFERLLAKGYEVQFTSHAGAILSTDFASQVGELEGALEPFAIDVVELIEGGGGEAPYTQRMRNSLSQAGWESHNFTISKFVDKQQRESISHEIDHVRTTANGTIALEIEWNNKAEFYDRDLENFKRLHSEGVFSVGVLITRGASFQRDIASIIDNFAHQNQVRNFTDLIKFEGYDPSRKFIRDVEKAVAKDGASFRDIWVKKFVSSKYATTTTHWSKLQERIARGVGNPCPLVLIGVPSAIIKR